MWYGLPARHWYSMGKDARPTRWITYFLDIPSAIAFSFGENKIGAIVLFLASYP
ncbi:hypothetical protein [Scytonema sp. NUACC21]